MKRTKIREGPWIKRRLDMMQSPAWRALSANAKCVIERLEIEHMLHAGKDNGRLVCTYQNFADRGIRHRSIATAIRNAVELGFMEIRQRGWRSAGHGRPALYRLTFLATDNAGPTDEWRHISGLFCRETHENFKGESAPEAGGESAPEAGGENAPEAGGENAPTWHPKPRGRKRPYILDATHSKGCAPERSPEPDAVAAVVTPLPVRRRQTPR
jgi:hypothetical protein